MPQKFSMNLAELEDGERVGGTASFEIGKDSAT